MREDEESGLVRPPPPGYAPRGPEGGQGDGTDEGCVTPPPPPAYQVAAQLPSYEEAERTKGTKNHDNESTDKHSSTVFHVQNIFVL